MFSTFFLCTAAFSTLKLPAFTPSKLAGVPAMPRMVQFPKVSQLIDFDKEIADLEKIIARMKEVKTSQEVIDIMQESLDSFREMKKKYK